ncbi:MAG TPA: hypothetical protein VK465_12590 [Fibrobacteria bacterium]|nr:hypothetical protein [Fibrobacteria bacterium]
MPLIGSPIYLSTLLLERNRANGKGPSLLVSDWMEPISEAGFGGLEIWMNHLFFSSRSEWDLIRDLSQEADLAIPILSSVLPADGSDKSVRLREALLEACDFFRPECLKLTPGRGDGALDFLRGWVKDVPREISILADCPEGDAGVDGLERLREALPGDRFRAVVHPFLLSVKEFEAVLASAGSFIGNLGVQAKQGGKWARLADIREVSATVIAAAGRRGFKGTWSLEYTKGAGQAGEDIDTMFDNSEEDLNFLTEILARSTADKG